MPVNPTTTLPFKLIRNTAILSLNLLVPLIAADLNVPSEYATIQAAINAATTGDTVLVAPGNYQENLVISKDISVESTDGADLTIIDANQRRGIEIGPNGAFIGFTVTNAKGSFGAGMRTYGSNSYIAQNIFEYNAQGSGGFGAAIAMNSSSPIIDSNIFRYNTADSQHLSGAVAMVNGSSPHIVNNIFHDNECRAIAATVPTSALPLVINNTIVRNEVGIRAVHSYNTSKAIYRNNIIAYNETGVEFRDSTRVDNQIWENNLVFGNDVDYADGNNGDPSNISADPLFLDFEGNDFQLKSKSSAVDTGTNMTAPEHDFDGVSRPIDGDADGVNNVDIGAYELALGIQITVDGGLEQECISPEGNQVLVNGIPFPSGLGISIEEVYLNDSLVSKTLPTTMLLKPGENTIYVKGNSNGVLVEAERKVSIIDTTAPSIEIRFVDQRTRKELSTFKPRFISKVAVEINVTDNCDPNPQSTSTMGTSIENGEQVIIFGQRKRMLLQTHEFVVTTTATDASENTITVTKKLEYSDSKNRSKKSQLFK